MKPTTAAVAAGLLCWALSAAGVPAAEKTEFAKDDDAPLGKEVQGLSCGLEVLRTECAPGEAVALRAYLRNTSKQTIQMPTELYPSQYGGRVPTCETLHLVTPDGKEYIYISNWTKELAYKPMPAGTVDPLIISSFAPAVDAARFSLVGGVGSPSLRAEGEYRLWVEYTARLLPDAPAGGWAGTVRSNEIRYTVKEMPASARQMKPSPEQLKWLRQARESPGIFYGSTGDLTQAMIRTENEGLALETVKQARELMAAGQRRSSAFLCLTYFLECRSGTLELVIDGPYLKAFAELILDGLEEVTRKDAGPEGPEGYHPLLIYLKAHPEDKDLRERAVKLALPYAKVSAFKVAGADPETVDHDRAHVYLYFSWDVLLGAGALHKGMDLAEAVKILGEPTRRDADSVSWFYESPMHVNPRMTARVENGKVVEFRSGRG